jgi:hypothetical protein
VRNVPRTHNRCASYLTPMASITIRSFRSHSPFLSYLSDVLKTFEAYWGSKDRCRYELSTMRTAGAPIMALHSMFEPCQLETFALIIPSCFSASSTSYKAMEFLYRICCRSNGRSLLYIPSSKQVSRRDSNHGYDLMQYWPNASAVGILK